MWIRILLTSLAGSVFPLARASAVSLEVNYPSFFNLQSSTTFPELIETVFQASLVISVLLLFIVIIWSGILYLTSTGNASKQREARRKLTSAFVGAFLLFLSYLALNIFAPELLVLRESGIPNVIECSDEIDNDGDGLIDLADPDCKDSSDSTEAPVSFRGEAWLATTTTIVGSTKIEYVCVETSDPGEHLLLPEVITDPDDPLKGTFPVVTRSEQALATLNTVKNLLREIYEDSKLIADTYAAQSSCSISAEDHWTNDGQCDQCGDCPIDPGPNSPGHFDCREYDFMSCHPNPPICGGDPVVCIPVPCTPHFHDGYHIYQRHNWHCHYAGGVIEPPSSPSHIDTGILAPTHSPINIPFIESVINAIDMVDSDGNPVADADDIKRTLEALVSNDADSDGKEDPIMKSNHSRIIPRSGDNDFLFSFKKIEQDLRIIRDNMQLCSRTPNNEVATCKNVLGRGVDTVDHCPDDNDFVCLFTPTK